MKCENFGCVYAMYSGCAIDGGMCEEERKTGEVCPHYTNLCDFADCKNCVRIKGQSEMCNIK